ncbi:hypothetical protein IC582_023907 [Cucumis melo]
MCFVINRVVLYLTKFRPHSASRIIIDKVVLYLTIFHPHSASRIVTNIIIFQLPIIGTKFWFNARFEY